MSVDKIGIGLVLFVNEPRFAERTEQRRVGAVADAAVAAIRVGAV